jgi:hypothetical protein
MRTRLRVPVLVLAAVLAAATAVFALDGPSIARLKRAGVSDAVIAALVREHSIETGAFSVDDILAMKAAGIGEKALVAVVSEGSFMKDREPVVYGGDLKPLSLSSPADLIALKQAGVSDEVLQAVAIVSRRGSDADRQEALEFLRASGVWVDLRHD